MKSLYQIYSIEGGSDSPELSEVYRLRVTSWHHSRARYIESMFPDGWYDSLDLTAVHFLIRDMFNAIVASARVNILNSPDDLSISKYFETYPYVDLSPVGHISRNVVHPLHQRLGLGTILDKLRLDYLRNKGVRYCFCSGERTGILARYGFEKICDLPTHASENIDQNPNVWIMAKDFAKEVKKESGWLKSSPDSASVF